MKKILVPIDFSQQSNDALEVAIQFSNLIKAEITVLHIVEAPIPSGIFVGMEFMPPSEEIGYLKSMVEEARLKMSKLIKDNRVDHQINLIPEMAIGNPYTHISSYIIDKEVDLVVMGSKGSSGMEEFFIGSTTEKVIRRAKCPVLTVKTKLDIFTIKNIVFASDFDEDELSIIHYIKDFQKWLNAKLHLVKINTPDQFETTSISYKKMEKFAQKYQLENYSFNVYNELSEEEGIVLFAEEIHAGLIALGTHGRTGIAHLFSGSIAETVANHSHYLILTIHLKG